MASELGPIEIRNFKCFKELKLKSVGRLNLISGKNNVGKTMFLDAISLLASGADPKRLFEIIDRRERPDSDGRLFLSMRDYIPLGDVMIRMGDRKLQLQIPAPTISPEGATPQWNEYRSKKASATQGSLYLTFDEQSFAFDLTLDTKAEAYSDKFAVEPKIRSTITKWRSTAELEQNPVLYRKLWDEEVDGRRAEQDLIGLLRLIDLEVESLTLPFSGGPNLPRIRLKDQDELLPISTFGEGLSRLFTLGLALVAAPKGFLFVDEIENGLHHTMFPKIWKFLFEACERLDITLFATTHSQDVTKAFAKRAIMQPKGTGIFTRLDQSESGIVAVQYSETGALIAAEEGYEVR
jgi:hypothetical protein